MEGNLPAAFHPLPCLGRVQAGGGRRGGEPQRADHVSGHHCPRGPRVRGALDLHTPHGALLDHGAQHRGRAVATGRRPHEVDKISFTLALVFRHPRLLRGLHRDPHRRAERLVPLFGQRRLFLLVAGQAHFACVPLLSAGVAVNVLPAIAAVRSHMPLVATAEAQLLPLERDRAASGRGTFLFPATVTAAGVLVVGSSSSSVPLSVLLEGLLLGLPRLVPRHRPLHLWQGRRLQPLPLHQHPLLHDAGVAPEHDQVLPGHEVDFGLTRRRLQQLHELLHRLPLTGPLLHLEEPRDDG